MFGFCFSLAIVRVGLKYIKVFVRGLLGVHWRIVGDGGIAQVQCLLLCAKPESVIFFPIQTNSRQRNRSRNVKLNQILSVFQLKLRKNKKQWERAIP